MQPLRQAWPPELAARYRAAGHWRGETFPALLRARATERLDAVAVVGGAARWTYAELHDRAERFAAGLLALGLRPGDRAVLQLPNVPEFLVAAFGLFRAGMIPVYALPAHRLTEVRHFALRSEAAAYVGPATGPGSFDGRALARELMAAVPAVWRAVILPVGTDGAAEFEDFAALDGPRDALPGDPAPDAVAFLQISGGTTGLSKLIPRTHDDYLYSCRASNAICGLDASGVFMATLPAAHNFTMSSPGHLGAIHAGARVVMCPAPGPDVAFPLIAREGVTITGLVPPLALLWAEAAATTGHDLSSLRTLLIGGAKLTPEAARRVEAGLPGRLQQVFGMAEGLVNYTRRDDPADLVLNTQGRPISADDEVLVVDDQGDPVPPGEPGHLLTRGPYTIRAYHDDPAADARAFTPDGFYRTGDVVRQLPSGHLMVDGRAGDHINRAGEKVSAEEVEDHLLAHPAVFDAAVVSVPDPFLGEAACAFVIPRPDAEKPRPAAIRAWMRGRAIAEFKVPDRVVLVDSFETTAAGKISRRELRARLRARLLEEEA